MQATIPLVQSLGVTFYFGMYLSVVGTEDIPFIDASSARASAEGTFLGYRMVRNRQKACRAWPHSDVPDDFSDPVSSDIPTILVSGFSDPVTAPRWVEVAAQTLPKQPAPGGSQCRPCRLSGSMRGRRHRCFHPIRHDGGARRELSCRWTPPSLCQARATEVKRSTKPEARLLVPGGVGR